MNKFIYRNSEKKNFRKFFRFISLFFIFFGLILGLYFSIPLLSWEFYLGPAIANQVFTSPIPNNSIISDTAFASLTQTADSVSGIDYSDAQNWLPIGYKGTPITTNVKTYFISIPKINIVNAAVSTVDTDLRKHLVHFPSTSVPPDKGNAVIFGHSTLPQLYDPGNYETILANALSLKRGDIIAVNVNNDIYIYKIFKIAIISAEDISFLEQNSNGNYLTIITCTPPGTTWKRLIIESKLEKI